MRTHSVKKWADWKKKKDKEFEEEKKRAFYQMIKGGSTATPFARMNDVQATTVVWTDPATKEKRVATGEEAMEAIKVHFKELYGGKESLSGVERAERWYEDARSESERQGGDEWWRVSNENVMEALQGAHKKKSPGCSGIAYEHWLELCEWSVEMCSRVADLFEGIFTSGEVPREFGAMLLWLLSKDEDKLVNALENTRSIALLNTLEKTFERVILLKIKTRVRNMLHEAQSVYTGRDGFGTATIVASLLDSIDTFLEEDEVNGMGEGVHVVAYDFRLAFDLVQHDRIAPALKRIGICDGLIKVIVSLHEKAHGVVKVRKGCYTKAFQVTTGVRQGSVLGPLIFATILDPLIGYLSQDESPRLVPRDDDELMRVYENRERRKRNQGDCGGEEGISMVPDRCGLRGRHHDGGSICSTERPAG